LHLVELGALLLKFSAQFIELSLLRDVDSRQRINSVLKTAFIALKLNQTFVLFLNDVQVRNRSVVFRLECLLK